MSILEQVKVMEVAEKAYQGILRSIPIVPEDKRSVLITALLEVLLPEQISAHSEHIMVKACFFEVSDATRLPDLERALREVAAHQKKLSDAVKSGEALEGLA